MKISIQVATTEQVHKVLSTTVLSFCTDPFVRWAVPDPHQYLTRYPEVFKVFINTAIASRSVYYASGFSGVSVWFPPDVNIDDQAIGAAIQNLGASPLNDLMGELFEKFMAFHPQKPHWYMPLMGVEPSFQGQGIGSAMLKHALHKCDQAHQLAYLEASSKQNLSLYERHGFEVLGSIKVGSSPVLFPMVREPR